MGNNYSTMLNNYDACSAPCMADDGSWYITIILLERNSNDEQPWQQQESEAGIWYDARWFARRNRALSLYQGPSNSASGISAGTRYLLNYHIAGSFKSAFTVPWKSQGIKSYIVVQLELNLLLFFKSSDDSSIRGEEFGRV